MMNAPLAKDSIKQKLTRLKLVVPRISFEKTPEKITRWNELIAECRKLKHLAKNSSQSKEGKIKTLLRKDGRENLDKKLAKFKKTLNEAMLLSVHNVPPVPGTSVFFIRKIQRPPRSGKIQGIGADPNIQVSIDFISNRITKT